MRKWVLLVISIILMAMFAGCLGGEAEDKKENTPELVQKHGMIAQISGWAESNWQSSDNEPYIVSVTIPIGLNNTNIVNIKFTINVQDSDAEHAETDDGSSPDDVTISATGGNLTTEDQQGTTPTSLSIEVRAEGSGAEVTYLSQNWNIQLNAECYGGKLAYPPLRRIVYKDQGVAYTIDAEYTYMAEETTM